ncbi:MAG TPA: metal-dependent hydrolase, partial [Nannocystaceae bacterium]|nr:metal-dependent hydrolase [Nannocystaceae bacterium]
MDPVTQGLLGAAAAQAVLARRLGPRTWLYGALGGMAADLDVLIRSSTDPMVAIVYHRHFTHSLAFVPIGGLICALPWLLSRRHRDRRWLVLVATTIGYATHGLLDAFTSYGTQLWWPFSSQRVAWNFVAIVDPIYTGMLAIGVVLARRRGSPNAARLALVLSSLYVALGGVLHARALAAVRRVAHDRGHVIARVEAFPELPVNFVWRSTYRAGGRIHIDRVRTPWLGPVTVDDGSSIAVVDESDLPPGIVADARLLSAFRTFAWFADGWVGRSPEAPDLLGDSRYGPATTSSDALWSLRLEPGADKPVQIVQQRPPGGAALAQRWREIVGR